MDNTTKKLASFCIETVFSNLAPSVVHECKRRIIDSLACAAAAYSQSFCSEVRKFAARYNGTSKARIWGSGTVTSTEMAALANGTAVRFLESNDTYLGKSAGHPSDMIPALLAIAESHPTSGTALITAIVVAYEVYCGLCASVAIQASGVDQATCAAVGTAAGAASLLRLSLEQAENAISLALVANISLYNVRCGELSDWKNCAGPHGASNGILAAFLARENFSGPSAIVEGKGGLFEVLSPFQWQVGEGLMPLIVDTHLKYHPVCYHGQSAIDAASKLHSAIPIEEIDDIHVETYEIAYRAMGADSQRWAPSTRETADHSLPYTVAVTLIKGRLDLEAYDKNCVEDPYTRAVMNKIRVSSSEQMSHSYPKQVGARVTIRSISGKTYSHFQELPKGHVSNPLSDSELEEKFFRLFAEFPASKPAEELLSSLWSLDLVANVAGLLDMMCPNISRHGKTSNAIVDVQF